MNIDIVTAAVVGLALVLAVALIVVLIGAICERRRMREVDALRETLAEMAREKNISEGEAARRKMRGQ